jgi:hypothetical protein
MTRIPQPETHTMKLHQIAAAAIALAVTGTAASQALVATDPSAAGSNWRQPEGGVIVLANQPNTGGTQGLISSIYATSPGNPITLVAIDFDVPAGQNVRLSRIDVDGFLSVGSPAISASAGVEYFVCENAATNTPACADPNQAPGRLWRYLAPIGSAGLTIGGTDNADPSLDLTSANQVVELAPGKYWLGVAVRWNAPNPGTGDVNGRWNWIQAGTGAAQFGLESHLVSPTLFTLPAWTPFSALGAAITSRDSAARIEALPAPPPTVPPVFGFTPAPGSTVTATGGTGLVGSTSNLSIAPAIATAGTGTGAPATTTLTCTAPTAPFAGFTQTVTAIGTGAITGGPLAGTCTRGAAAATQTLTCSENRGGTPTTRTWTLSCPAGTIPSVPVNATSAWSLIALMLALFGFAAVMVRRQG